MRETRHSGVVFGGVFGVVLGITGLLTLFGAILGPPMLGASPVRYGTACTKITNVALSTTSEVVVASEPTRKKVTITNNDTAIAIHICMSATATTACPRVGPGQSWTETVEDGYIYTGTIDAIAASGTPAISGESCI